MGRKRNLWLRGTNYIAIILIIWSTASFQGFLNGFFEIINKSNVEVPCDSNYLEYFVQKTNFAFIEHGYKYCGIKRPNTTIAHKERPFHKNYDHKIRIEKFMLDKRKPNVGFMVVSGQKLPDFTTERNIFTGLVSTPVPTPPPKDYEIFAEQSNFATKALFLFSWNVTLNVTKIEIRYSEKDATIRYIEFPKINLTADHTLNVFKPGELRKGFRYMIVGFSKFTFYFVQSCAYYGRRNTKICANASLRTGESDRDERLYNLEGIFLVLGISTIIMVVVLLCVGYEKLIHQKKKDCIDFICCRRKSKRNARVHNRGSLSPEPLMVRRDPNISPVEEDFAAPGPSSKRR